MVLLQKKRKSIVLIDPLNKLTEWISVTNAALDTDTIVIAIQLENVLSDSRLKTFIPSSSTLKNKGVHHVVTFHSLFPCVQELKILARKNNYSIDCVIPLSEMAVDFSDMLGACLGVPHNSLELATSRWDKDLMMQAISEKGILVAQITRIESVDELLPSMEKLGISFPVIVETPQVISTNAFICETLEEANSAVRSIVDEEPNEHHTNAALLKEHISGVEFTINLMACNGNYVVTDVWKFEENPYLGYGSADICYPYAHPELVEYAKAVAKAVGIKYGAANVELKAKKGRNEEYCDPILMKIVARLPNGKKSMMCATGCNPYSTLIDAHSGYFQKKQEDFQPTQFARHLFLPIVREGKVKGLHYDFTSLTTLHSKFLPLKVGDFVSKTTGHISCAGFIWLTGDRSEVENDTEKIVSTFHIDIA